MDWEALGAIGEIIGAIAVIATLIYLAFQIRQNTAAVVSSSFEAGVSQYNDFRLKVADSEELSQLWFDGLSDPQSLSDNQRNRFRILVAAFLDIANVSYLKRNLNLFSESSWKSGEATLIRIIVTPGGRWYFEYFKNTITLEFQACIKKILDGHQD